MSVKVFSFFNFHQHLCVLLFRGILISIFIMSMLSILYYVYKTDDNTLFAHIFTHSFHGYFSNTVMDTHNNIQPSMNYTDNTNSTTATSSYISWAKMIATSLLIAYMLLRRTTKGSMKKSMIVKSRNK